MTGYQSSLYCRSLRDVGAEIELPGCGGQLLKREIPGGVWHDAMGCYPVFSCRDWSKVPEDLESLGTELVSVALVTDPFGGVDPGKLSSWFPDRMIPFKQHFVTDLSRKAPDLVHPHHRRKAEKALRSVTVQRCHPTAQLLDEWVSLYDVLVQRHSIRGVTAFSRDCFALQFAVPGLVLFRAQYEGICAGMLLWYLQKDRAYYHLGAYSAQGYAHGVSFALFATAIEHFASTGVRWLCLGGGAGAASKVEDGLARFKRGWATETRTVYFCGKILNRTAYEALAQERAAAGDYFPVYRSGEFSL